MKNEFYSTREASDKLIFSPCQRTVERMIRRGELKAVKVKQGKSYCYKIPCTVVEKYNNLYKASKKSNHLTKKK